MKRDRKISKSVCVAGTLLAAVVVTAVEVVAYKIHGPFDLLVETDAVSYRAGALLIMLAQLLLGAPITLVTRLLNGSSDNSFYSFFNGAVVLLVLLVPAFFLASQVGWNWWVAAVLTAVLEGFWAAGVRKCGKTARCSKHDGAPPCRIKPSAARYN